MKQTVYIDLFFMINFSMDFLCFFLSSQLLSARLRLGRVICASALGGIYASVALFMQVGSAAALLIDVLVCVLMCAIGFWGVAPLWSFSAVYIAVSMTLGGFMSAIFSLLNRADLPLGEVEGDGISAWALAILALVSAGITYFGGRFFKKKISKRYATVKILMGDKQVTLKAFCDSGNLLRDPITARPCIVADLDALSDVVPLPIAEVVRGKSVAQFSSLGADAARRLRLIPSKTATGEGMMVAMRADGIFIEGDGGDKELDALLALSPTGKFEGDCRALLPSSLLM